MTSLPDNRPVLVIVTADTCKACDLFKSKFKETLVRKVLGEGKLRLVDVSLPNMRTKPDSHYPTELADYIQWYPTFLLFTGMSWNRGRELEGVVFNGKLMKEQIVDNKIYPRKAQLQGGTELTDTNILNWINSELTTNPIFFNARPTDTLRPKGVVSTVSSQQRTGMEGRNVLVLPNRETAQHNEVRYVPTIGSRIRYKPFTFNYP